jgi:hypothetical protein
VSAASQLVVPSINSPGTLITVQRKASPFPWPARSGSFRGDTRLVELIDVFEMRVAVGVECEMQLKKWGFGRGIGSRGNGAVESHLHNLGMGFLSQFIVLFICMLTKFNGYWSFNFLGNARLLFCLRNINLSEQIESIDQNALKHNRSPDF